MTSLDQKQKREKVQKLLEQMDSPEKLYEFFEQTGYEKYTKDPSYKRDISEFNLKEKAENKLENIYTVLDYQDEITVLLIETESLSKGHVRYISERLARKFNYVLPIFTTDHRTYQFVLPTFDEKTPGEIDVKLTKLEVDSKNVFYSDADALGRIWIDEEKRYPHIWNQWEKAFSIDKVTEQFFEDYQEQFFQIREKVLEQVDDVHDAHEFTLQFMNRMMFVYFVDKKGWLEGEEGESYIQWLLDKYAAQGGLQDDSENKFYEKWLTTLFHKAFNNKFRGNVELPEHVSKSFERAPYLNGGLFRENSLTKLDVELEDELVSEIIEGFFERYNFTIKEDSPVDKEVAVDPQMIGYVYESLSNVAEQLEDLDKDSRKEFGIFYTPKEEVYFMVRRSLVEYLNNNTEIPKEKIYRLIFAETDDQKDKAIEELSSGEFNQITLSLRSMKVVDPACGSGAFLVGIIDEIAKVYRIAEGKDRREFDMFETKKKIIQESIYGVDVKDWAINASELRLFLQLLIETDIDKEKIQQDALLPNLRANLRVGDSLVQDIDGTFFDVSEKNRSVEVNSWIERIQREKSYFFDSREKSEYGGIADIQLEEFELAKQLITDKIETLEEQIEKGKTKQQTLSGEVKEEGLSDKEVEEIEEKIGELEDLKSEVEGSPDKVPLIWEVAFAEVFKEKDGFDLVIGNPPYVKSQKISPPNMPSEEATKEQKSKYKDLLEKSAIQRIPPLDSISGRSDLYVYFYFHSLSLINQQGTFCFITSNSWLDTSFGADLQEYLGKYVPIQGIYKSDWKQSFEHAEVNTVISVFNAPDYSINTKGGVVTEDRGWSQDDHTANFIRVKNSYSETINPEFMIELEEPGESLEFNSRELSLKNTNFSLHKSSKARSVTISQRNLLLDGWEDQDSFPNGSYNKNKWGAKFLKAPDIFYDIVEKSGEQLETLEDSCEIDSYLNTEGADKFFFLKLEEEKDKTKIVENIEHEEEFEVEKEYLKPIIKSSRTLNSVKVSEEDTNLEVLVIPEDEDLEETKVKDYIDFAKEKGYNKATGPSKHDPWWKPPKRAKKSASIMLPNRFHDSHPIYYNPDGVISNRFYRIYAEEPEALATTLNSTLTSFFVELFGNTGLGGGALEMYKPDYNRVMFFSEEEINAQEDLLDLDNEPLFDQLGLNISQPLEDQEIDVSEELRELDQKIFDEIGLEEDEIERLYIAVASMMRDRLKKSGNTN